MPSKEPEGSSQQADLDDLLDGKPAQRRCCVAMAARTLKSCRLQTR